MMLNKVCFIMKRALGPVALACTLLSASQGVVKATPLVPTSDSAVIETLPAQWGDRQAQRRQRQALARSPRDVGLAVSVARRHLALARTLGDARYAGLAQGALSAWPVRGAGIPTEVLLMRATVAQFLHDFEGAEAMLMQVTQSQPQHAQAWLTLATIRRVQGRYAQSNGACRQVIGSGQMLHGSACLAENLSLLGHNDEARAQLRRLLLMPEVLAPTGSSVRQWLMTSLAELEERAGRPSQAEQAWRAALALGPDPYVQTGYADFLLQQQRHAEVLALLQGVERTDGVMLRLSIAAHRLKVPEADGWRQDMSARLAAVNSRPGAGGVHAREQARFALEVMEQPSQALALALAQQNLAHQRETADWLLMAQAAQAQTDRSAQQQALAQLKSAQQSTGIVDARLAKL
jgi:hypothetical protein